MFLSISFLYTGFVFSFPSEQLALNSQRLLTWTQTFRCPDGPGLDPVTLLEDAIKRRPKVCLSFYNNQKCVCVHFPF